MLRIAALIVVLGHLYGCASREAMILTDLEPGQLPRPNITLEIPGLGPCTDSPDRNLRFDSSQPLNILVHGCFGSSGQFRGLAQVMAFQGQQTACFTYDDRARLTQSADELRRAILQLTKQSDLLQIALIGHSQGALIARNSLTEFPLTPLPNHHVDLRLVTISGPFSGIESAQTCGRGWLYPLTLGLLPLSCYVATGPKWMDITYSSRFIREPGVLAWQVTDYLKIDTNERDSCRREVDGKCMESDDIFSLDEQRNMDVESDSRTKRVVIRAGHVEIVGDKRVAPTKLITVLQKEGVIRATEPGQEAAFRALLSQIYQDGTLH